MSGFQKLLLVSAACLLASTPGCGRKNDLVLYSAGDKMFTSEIIQEFEQETGLNVIVASDTEMDRGVALRSRILKEKGNPQADVYWNNELANTILLRKSGALVPYKSPSAEDIPAHFRDPEGYWTAFGARARIFIVNTDLVSPREMPGSMYDMLDPKWKGKVGISRITGGTTATHAAALFELLGDEKAKRFYADLKRNGAVLCQGNGHVKDLVADGELAWGWTDTNDANVAIMHGKPVKVVYPDQGEDQIGTLIIPHSVSLIRGGPNGENGRKFIDFLLRKETEFRLATSASVQIPVRGGIYKQSGGKASFIMDIDKIKNFNSKIDFSRVAERLPSVIDYLDRNFNN
jgi:iron(III) transport system substrate-binding protein